MEPAEPGSGADNEPDDALVAAPDEAEALRPDDELEALYTCTPNALSAPEAALDPDADAYAALNLEDAEKEILRQVARDEVEARLEDCGAEDVALARRGAPRDDGRAPRAVRGCAGLLRPSVAGARALALSVAKGSRAIVHRAIRHMAVCTTVGSLARASVVDAASSVALRCGADVELQQTAAGLVAWFANVVCKQSFKALRDALLEAALELRRAEAGDTGARDEFARPFATFAELDDDPKADAVFRLRRALRLRLLTTLAVVRARGFDDGAAAAVAAGCEVLSSVRLDGTRVGDAGVAALAAGLRSTLGRSRSSRCGAASHLGDVGVAAVARVCAPRAPGGAAASLPAELAFLERRR
ncbi:hypothetical protein JL721_2995 [Aureococcus anophagefferens]|nr:hypothetical protein JL721_2995 [Aureococcus anophagefferens]